MTFHFEYVAFKPMSLRVLTLFKQSPGAVSHARLACSLLAAGLLAAAPLRAQEAAEATAPLEGKAASAAGGAAGREDATLLEFRAPAKANPYREHAPLAFFSLGSLAMGGVFYGIHRSLDNPGGSSFSGDGTRVNAAIGAAGISALAAGAAYLWYAVRAERPDASGWTETVSAGMSPDGGVAATLTVPLSSLSD